MTELLTHSRLQSFKVCRRQHWYTYEHAVRRAIDAKALRMGSAFHAGLEWLARTNLAEGYNAIWREYQSSPDSIDERDWQIECETVTRLVGAYDWHWGGHSLTFVEVEQAFDLPLLNPDTEKPTPNFRLAGKIDGIVRLEDGRLAVLERKLLSDELDSDAMLWRRLRIDQQITLYVYAARRLGHEVDCVLYDVARKPTISPTSVPLTDDWGKIVLDANGERILNQNGKPRQTADKERGYVLQTRDMTPEEWGDKLTADIASRPDYYFARREVPRLDDDIKQFERELWEQQRTIRETQLNGRWYRTAHKHTCDYCPVFDLCTVSFDPANGALPESFVFAPDPHPELSHVSPNESASTGATETTAVA